ncbi:histidine kinase [Akkermansiaceae bacterium]|nr:histidine kinase [Akkermansiaceae bacterium]
MFRSIYSLVFCLIFGGSPAFSAGGGETASADSIDQLKQRLVTIDRSLDNLAALSIRGGFGPIGLASKQYATPQQTIWFEINLEELTPIDQIVIVPTIGQDSQLGMMADGFPVEFTVLAGKESDRDGVVIARYDESDVNLSRATPLVIDCSVDASWVRIEVAELSQHVLNDRYILKLSEVLVFNGSENVALRRPVKTSPGFMRNKSAQHPQFVTDGFLPYLMDAAHGHRSKPVISIGDTNEPYVLSMDLGEVISLTHINLHALYSNFSVPLYTAADEGIPHHWILEGSLTADFSDTVVLAEVQYTSLLEVGPVLRHRTEEYPSRYIRLREVTPSFSTQEPRRRRDLGLAEIELIAGGENVAAGKTFTLNFGIGRAMWAQKLTDGNNFYGEILPVRRWMNELAERDLLMLERQEINATLNRLYSRQQARFIWMQRITIGALAGIIIAVLISRMIAFRKIIRLRERIAANLHDELSANLHAVALLGDLAQQNIDRKSKLEDILGKIQDLSRHSRHAARHCMNMLQAETACDDLVEEVERTSQRLLTEIDHQLTVTGEEWIQQLSAQKRLDLSLYYKECLVNILRHSDATVCQTRLTGTSASISLEIIDNGSPFEGLPSSLMRRVKLLGATLNKQVPKDGGNRISLVIKTKRFSFWYRKGEQHLKEDSSIS